MFTYVTIIWFRIPSTVRPRVAMKGKGCERGIHPMVIHTGQRAQNATAQGTGIASTTTRLLPTSLNQGTGTTSLIGTNIQVIVLYLLLDNVSYPC